VSSSTSRTTPTRPRRWPWMKAMRDACVDHPSRSFLGGFRRDWRPVTRGPEPRRLRPGRGRPATPYDPGGSCLPMVGPCAPARATRRNSHAPARALTEPRQPRSAPQLVRPARPSRPAQPAVATGTTATARTATPSRSPPPGPPAPPAPRRGPL